MTTIDEFFKEAVQLLDKSPLQEYISVKEISLNSRLKRILGRYFVFTKKIEISEEVFYCCEKQDILKVILHELCHNICEEKYGRQKEHGGHTEKWYEIGEQITEITGIPINRRSSLNIDESKKNKNSKQV